MIAVSEEMKNEDLKDPSNMEQEASEETASENTETSAEEKTTEKAPEKEGFFKKKKDPKDEKIEELTDRVKRQMAEFDNFRKRNTEERERLGRFVTASVVREFLKVLDNFERAEASVEKNHDAESILKGMAMIHKQFEKALETLHIEEIPAEGKPFDPQIHEAVMQGSNPDLPDDSIDMVLEKGYRIGDDVIRHSKVRVVHN